MKVFHCGCCETVAFFEDARCAHCGTRLAFLPDVGELCAVEPADDGLWRPQPPSLAERRYRLCEHNAVEGFCNWMVAQDDANPQCLSCRLTRMIPNQSLQDHFQAWAKLEAAKRRLVYSLIEFGLPIQDRSRDPENGLVFDFLADSPDGEAAEPVMTGHSGGAITINVAEADDAERERRRQQMGEPYRTLLGHFRHEIGHYYWDRLIRDSDRIDAFRRLFGDEREDYAAAAQRHYSQGAPPDWAVRHVSAYASMHAWEDWAETWAHYMHIVSTLDTAAQCGLKLAPSRRDVPALSLRLRGRRVYQLKFESLIEHWLPLSFLLNNLTRSLGQADAYPFVLPPPAIDKLRFVHDTIRGAARSAGRGPRIG